MVERLVAVVRRRGPQSRDCQGFYAEGHALIIRLERGRVPASVADAFNAEIRDAVIPRVRKQPGLVALDFGRFLEDDHERFVIVTIWRSIEAMTAFVGPDVDAPRILDGLKHEAEQVDVECHESIAVVWPGVAVPEEPR